VQAGVAMLSLAISLAPSNVTLSPTMGTEFYTDMSQSFSASFDDDNKAADQLAARLVMHTKSNNGKDILMINSLVKRDISLLQARLRLIIQSNSWSSCFRYTAAP